MRKLLGLIAVLGGMSACPEAKAATLRTMTTLHGPNILLSDLFDNAGKNADRSIGFSPAPGDRIVVEAAQLNGIARQYGVDWRSISEGDRAVLELPGRSLPREGVIEATRVAVTAGEDIPDFDIELFDFTPPMVPAEANPASTVSQVELNRLTGRFTALLTVTGDGMSSIHANLAGHIEEMAIAPVAITRILPDTVLRPGDVDMKRIPKALYKAGVALSFDDLDGKKMRRLVAAGAPFRLEDLVLAPVVQKGSLVAVELAAPGIFIDGSAVALENGGLGEMIKIQPKHSSSPVQARVVAAERVSIDPTKSGKSVTRTDRIFRPQ